MAAKKKSAKKTAAPKRAAKKLAAKKTASPKRATEKVKRTAKREVAMTPTEPKPPKKGDLFTGRRGKKRAVEVIAVSRARNMVLVRDRAKGVDSDEPLEGFHSRFVRSTFEEALSETAQGRKKKKRKVDALDSPAPAPFREEKDAAAEEE